VLYDSPASREKTAEPAAFRYCQAPLIYSPIAASCRIIAMLNKHFPSCLRRKNLTANSRVADERPRSTPPPLKFRRTHDHEATAAPIHGGPRMARYAAACNSVSDPLRLSGRRRTSPR